MSQIPAAHQQRTKKEATDNRREGVTAEPPPCWAETWVVVIIGPVELVLFVVKLGVLVETLGRRVEAVAAGVSEAGECEKKEEEEEVGETVVLIAVV